MGPQRVDNDGIFKDRIFKDQISGANADEICRRQRWPCIIVIVIVIVVIVIVIIITKQRKKIINIFIFILRPNITNRWKV